MSIYQEYGYNSRKDYLMGLVEEYGVALEKVLTLASMLGPDEDFDGLLTSLEDIGGEE
jgi:hypothetical protein